MLDSKMQFEQFLNKDDKMTNTFNLQNVSRRDTWFLIKQVPPKNSHGFDGISSILMSIGASKLVIPTGPMQGVGPPGLVPVDFETQGAKVRSLGEFSAN